MFTDKEVFSTCVEKYNCFNAAVRKGSAVLEPMNDIERYVSIVEKMQKTTTTAIRLPLPGGNLGIRGLLLVLPRFPTNTTAC